MGLEPLPPTPQQPREGEDEDGTIAVGFGGETYLPSSYQPVSPSKLVRPSSFDPSSTGRRGHRYRYARQAPESTVGQPMAACRQGIYVEYSMEYSKCRALNGILDIDARAPPCAYAFGWVGAPFGHKPVDAHQ
eukprot:1180450-Prorocentrum_minimum.AAC.1